MSIPDRGTQDGVRSRTTGCARVCAEASNGARSGSNGTGVVAVVVVVRRGAVTDIWVRTVERM